MRPIDGDELLGIEQLLDTDVVRKCKTASWLLDQVLYDIQAMPTLPQPSNEALTCTGCVYRKREGWNYEQCVRCKRHWGDRYRRPPEGEEDA